MDIFDGLSEVFTIIERPQLTENEKKLISELGLVWSGTEINCALLNISVEVIKILDDSNSVIYNYITKLNHLLKGKGCEEIALYNALNPPIFGKGV